MRPGPLVLSLCLLLAACAAPRTAPRPGGAATSAEVEAAVRALIAQQQADWNAGSIRGFMDGYAQTDTLAFLSGGSMRIGWEESLYAYVRGYPDAAAMGTLTFSELTVKPLAPGLALAYGRWALAREDADGAGGLFSLLVAETEDGWRVVHDHTSSG